MMLIRHWFNFLFPQRPDEIILSTISPDTFLDLVHPRVILHTRPATMALLPFHTMSVRSAIHEAKYHGTEHAFALLAASLAKYLRTHNTEFRKPIIIPIPLGRKRHIERGFNQIEDIVQRAVSGLDISIDTTVLERTRETISQVSLPSHEREENMRGAFKTAGPIDPLRTYIVVDDVITTGATLQAAIDALSQAGAKYIVPLALAH